MKSLFPPKKCKLIYQSIFSLLLAGLLLVVPLNIVRHFNSQYAYVDGYFVNYLDFVIHIIDIAVLLLVVWMLVAGKFWTNRKLCVWLVVILQLYILHNLIFRDVVVFYSSTRLLLYLYCAVLIFFSDRLWNVWILFLVAILCACIQSAIAMLQFYLGRNLGLSVFGESILQVGGYATSSVVLPSGVELRGYGTFPHPNVLGGYLASVLLSVYFLLVKVKGLKRILLIGAAVLILGGVLVTWSRSAWLVILLVFMFGLTRKVFGLIKQGSAGLKTVKITLMSTGVVLAVSCGWIWMGQDDLSQAIHQRLLSQTSISDVSVVERRNLLERSFSMIKNNPFWGVGVGNFIPELAKDPVYTESGLRLMQPVHNVFVLIIAEAGILGCALVICMAYWLIRAVKKYGLGSFAVPAIAVVLAAGMLDHYLWTLPQGLGILLSLVINGKIFIQSNNVKPFDRACPSGGPEGNLITKS
ncbi:MAG: O-antigen ligase family protein [Patescibacteria group bacterium]|nr:O-antigen ligase family protein [Patescibacteria group bacterium]